MIEMIQRIFDWVVSLDVDGTQKVPPRTGLDDEPANNGMASIRERQRIVRGVRDFFDRHYELRYNLLKQSEEFRPKVADGRGCPLQSGGEAALSQPEPTIVQPLATLSQQEATIGCRPPIHAAGEPPVWRQLTDRELRKIALEQMDEVGVAWTMDVELYVRSALVPHYNPVTDYLAHCGEWDGRDRIRGYARRVRTSFSEWPDYFHRWVLAMVAQWIDLSDRFGNAVVPMLIGDQGTHKTTFCRQLLPPELRDYYIDDIKLDSSEQVERMLCRMLLVNIDEYNSKTIREQAKIKRLLTEKSVQTRKMRSDQYELRPRMASFIATTNDREPLTDPTGSRRYLCCEVEGVIDTDSPVDHRQLFAQAVAELRGGERWHFSPEEEAAIAEHNEDYRCLSSPEVVLLAHFQPAPPRSEYFIRASEIQAVLRKHMRQADLPSIKQLTLTLRDCHFQHSKVNGVRGWYARGV